MKIKLRKQDKKIKWDSPPVWDPRPAEVYRVHPELEVEVEGEKEKTPEAWLKEKGYILSKIQRHDECFDIIYPNNRYKVQDNLGLLICDGYKFWGYWYEDDPGHIHNSSMLYIDDHKTIYTIYNKELLETKPILPKYIVWMKDDNEAIESEE